MRTRSDRKVRLKSNRLTELRNIADDLERRLAEARHTLEHEFASVSSSAAAGAGSADRGGRSGHGGPHGASAAADFGAGDYEHLGFAREEAPTDGRTAGLLSRGRSSAQSTFLTRKRLLLIGVPALLVLIIILIVALSGGGASWPASVSTVQTEITRACLNSDVTSEPGQGHQDTPAAVEAIRRFNVTEKDMPPRRIIDLGRQAGFRRFRVYPHAYDLQFLIYQAPEPPAPRAAGTLGRLKALLRGRRGTAHEPVIGLLNGAPQNGMVRMVK